MCIGEIVIAIGCLSSLWLENFSMSLGPGSQGSDSSMYAPTLRMAPLEEQVGSRSSGASVQSRVDRQNDAAKPTLGPQTGASPGGPQTGALPGNAVHAPSEEAASSRVPEQQEDDDKPFYFFGGGGRLGGSLACDDSDEDEEVDTEEDEEEIISKRPAQDEVIAKRPAKEEGVAKRPANQQAMPNHAGWKCKRCTREAEARRRKRYREGCHLDSEEELTLDEEEASDEEDELPTPAHSPQIGAKPGLKAAHSPQIGAKPGPVMKKPANVMKKPAKSM